MKYDPGKSFPYPVLRPRSTDYQKVEFQVTCNIERVEGGTEISIVAEFNLSDPDLISEVKFKRAQYVLLVRCQSTYFRREIRSGSNQFRHSFKNGILAGRTEISPFLTCKSRLSKFHARNWHDDYRGLSFDLEEGSVLALDYPYVFWIDRADEGPIGSIFELRLIRDMEDGKWNCDPDADRVQLQLSESDFRTFCDARGRVQNSPRATFIMNGVYLPALAWLLNEADEGQSIYSERRWYSSLETRLAACDCKPLGKGTNRLRDTQVLLERPFSKLLRGLLD